MASQRKISGLFATAANVHRLFPSETNSSKIRYSNMTSLSTMTQNKPRFPQLHIVHPSSGHKHTILMLHGLGSNGPAFADEFFSSKASTDLRVRFPHVRWVFPTSVTRSVPRFQPERGEYRARPAWFLIESIADLEQHQQVQMEGLSETTEYLNSVITDEVSSLQAIDRNRKDLFVLGRSQGSSAAVWAILSSLRDAQPIGGLMLAGSWLIFARSILQALCKDYETVQINGAEPPPSELAKEFVTKALAIEDPGVWMQHHGLLETPIHVSHSTDDIYISIALGRQMRDVLQQLGCKVQWKEYAGAEGEGHWFREPEELDSIAEFVESQIRSDKPRSVE